jgi:uncharacterized protein (UPF0128 family)
LRVGGEQCDAFDERLGQQDSVKRIFVQRRKRVDADGVLARNRQLDVTVVEKGAPKNARLDAEIIAGDSRPAMRVWTGGSWIPLAREHIIPPALG